MDRFKRYGIAIAAIFGFQLASSAEAGVTLAEAESNPVLERIARIQQQAASRTGAPRVSDNPQIAQWYNWSDWSDWSNWQNWYNG